MKRLAANAALLLVTIFVSFAFLEIAVRLLDLMGPARQAAFERRDSENVGAGAQEADAPASRWILHPYRGISTRPGEQLAGFRGTDRRNNILGVVDDVVDPRELPEDDIVVAVFGGSVAMSTALEGGRFMKKAIEETGWPRGRNVRVVNFAIAGYKQPQQLFLLSEAILLGTPFDVVVNLDGFNEVALGGTDANKGHHPVLPNQQFWNLAFGSSTGSLSMQQIELTAAAVHARRRAQKMRASFKGSFLRRSAILQALVGAMASRADGEAVATEARLQELAPETPERDRYSLESPCLGRSFECWDLILDLWKRSSRGMDALAGSVGASYFHAVQPNQYYEGSKTFNDEERAIAWAPERPWSQAAALAYPLLREAGSELEAEGIHWLDLTEIFADRQDTIYKDPCCHYKPIGYRIVAEEIGRTIGETLLAEEASPVKGQAP